MVLPEIKFTGGFQMTSNQAQNFSIGDTAKMTGATQKQIRNWEAQGHIPKADRVKSGDRAYRRFTLRHIEMISQIKAFLDEGYTLSAAAQKAGANK
jgi:DNA-binding transcriptional MerR regulator